MKQKLKLQKIMLNKKNKKLVFYTPLLTSCKTMVFQETIIVLLMHKFFYGQNYRNIVEYWDAELQ